MGAHTFINNAIGKKLTASDAYNELVADALHSDGHDAYNGTISTTSGFVMVDLPTGRRADVLIDHILSGKSAAHRNIEKWGPAGCIEIKGKALTDLKKRRGLSGTRARGFIFFGWASS